jgi:hypothetical protein
VGLLAQWHCHVTQLAPQHVQASPGEHLWHHFGEHELLVVKEEI